MTSGVCFLKRLWKRTSDADTRLTWNSIAQPSSFSPLDQHGGWFSAATNTDQRVAQISHQHPRHANDNDALIPGIWAHEGPVIFEENMVAANLVHRDFEDEIKNFGDVVNTRRPGNFKISGKVDGTALTQQDANATNVQVPLDQWFYTSFTIKDGEHTVADHDILAGLAVLDSQPAVVVVSQG